MAAAEERVSALYTAVIGQGALRSVSSWAALVEEALAHAAVSSSTYLHTLEQKVREVRATASEAAATFVREEARWARKRSHTDAQGAALCAELGARVHAQAELELGQVREAAIHAELSATVLEALATLGAEQSTARMALLELQKYREMPITIFSVARGFVDGTLTPMEKTMVETLGRAVEGNATNDAKLLALTGLAATGTGPSAMRDFKASCPNLFPGETSWRNDVRSACKPPILRRTDLCDVNNTRAAVSCLKSVSQSVSQSVIKAD